MSAKDKIYSDVLPQPSYVPCRKCAECRQVRANEWALRLYAEAQCYEKMSFITLTYSDEFLPVDGSVDPRALQLFMKRLRKSEEPVRLRFYGVGEYGEDTGRPHYHIAVFGMRPCDRINTQVRVKYRGAGVCCEVCTRVRDLWAQGHAFVGHLEARSAAYVAGYVTKKIGGSGLNGGHPPFARMSNRPGIGCFFMDEVASTILEHGLEKVLSDVPNWLRTMSKKKLPIGRYLKRELRKRIGRDGNAPVEVIQAWSERMQPMREFAQGRSSGSYEDALRGVIQDLGLGRRLQLEGLERRRTRRKGL